MKNNPFFFECPAIARRVRRGSLLEYTLSCVSGRQFPRTWQITERRVRVVWG
jgi:hypothetical protein